MFACIPQVQEPLNSCSIAARLSGSENGLGVPLNAFHGQMGCIYLFEDILSPGMHSLRSLREPHAQTLHLHLIAHLCCEHCCLRLEDFGGAVTSKVLYMRSMDSLPFTVIFYGLPLLLLEFLAGSCLQRKLFIGAVSIGHAVCALKYCCSIISSLAAAQVGALHALGPDYQSTFSPLESDAVLEQMPAAAALVVDGKEALGPRLMISYNAQVCGSLPRHRSTLLSHATIKSLKTFLTVLAVQKVSQSAYKYMMA